MSKDLFQATASNFVSEGSSSLGGPNLRRWSEASGLAALPDCFSSSKNVLCPIQEKLVKLVSWWPLLRRREFKFTMVGWDGWMRLRAARGHDGKKARFFFNIRSDNKTEDGEVMCETRL